jgi:hypothetical protein
LSSPCQQVNDIDTDDPEEVAQIELIMAELSEVRAEMDNLVKPCGQDL